MTQDDLPLDAAACFAAWLNQATAALQSADTAAFAGLFDRDGHWRDLLSLTWDFRSFSGQDTIANGFLTHAAEAGLGNLRVAEGRSAPVVTRRSGRDVVEGYFEFDTRVGGGVGFTRLLIDPLPARVWQLVTTLHELRGFEEKIGSRRPSGEEFSRIVSPKNWLQRREQERDFAERDPQVVIIGAGHGGLMLGARLRQIGADVLVVEKTPRVGDVWRNRYNNLTLHNEIYANHFPYMKFPDTWPTWLPKDMIGDWLESYAKFMELNVWTGTQLVSSRFDETEKVWHLILRREDGTERPLRCQHLVAAMGVSGGVPKKARVPGLDEFTGTVMHSSAFTTGVDWKGKRAIVVGTGNSGHDIAQDLYVSGAESVSIMQRGPTCVISLEPSATISYSIYAGDRSVEDVDLATAAIPYETLIETYQWITKKTRELDRPMLEGLEAAGFKTYQGADETGFQLLYLRGAGGYYIDVGCSELIIAGKIPILQADRMDRFVAGGLRLKDGSVVPCDLVVLATGFEGMQESIRRLLGDEIADRVGPVWGFDDDYNLRGVWRRTGQDNFWVMGGSIIEARLFSRFLALQIKASLEGLMPSRKSLAERADRVTNPAVAARERAVAA